MHQEPQMICGHTIKVKFFPVWNLLYSNLSLIRLLSSIIKALIAATVDLFFSTLFRFFQMTWLGSNLLLKLELQEYFLLLGYIFNCIKFSYDILFNW